MHTVTCPGLSARSDRHRVANRGRHRSPPQTHGHVLHPSSRQGALPPAPRSKSLAWAGVERRLWEGPDGDDAPGTDRAGSLAALPRGSVPGWRTRSPPAASGPARPSQTPRVELGRRGGHEDRAGSHHGQTTHVSGWGAGRALWLLPGLRAKRHTGHERLDTSQARPRRRGAGAGAGSCKAGRARPPHTRHASAERPRPAEARGQGKDGAAAPGRPRPAETDTHQTAAAARHGGHLRGRRHTGRGTALRCGMRRAFRKEGRARHFHS